MRPVGLFASLIVEPKDHRRIRPILNAYIAKGMSVHGTYKSKTASEITDGSLETSKEPPKLCAKIILLYSC